MKFGVLRFILVIICFIKAGSIICNEEIKILRDEVKSMFLHGYESYLKYAYPHDELLPLSCGYRSHEYRKRGDLDDVLGGYMLTLIDSLDTLLVMKEYEKFNQALLLLKPLSFDRNVNISVFEANIRVVGGLLSAHQLASTINQQLNFSYDGKTLLNHAEDLAQRLLPAFNTFTGVPIHRINLQSGLIKFEKTQTCPAAGGSFILEMGLLSRLTGNPIFETAARKASKGLWERRSNRNLMGSLFNVANGQWELTHTGIGAGVDSYYETLLKSYILLGDDSLLYWFEEAYQAIQSHTFLDGWNVEVDMYNGKPRYYYVSALQAFWPALQTLYGRVNDAQLTLASFQKLWRTFGALPDIFDSKSKSLLQYSRDSPLRPEIIESTYYLFMATKDPSYLDFAKEILWSIQNKSKVNCGYASIADVETGKLDDRMDSFFLSESLKYLYLLFDAALPNEEKNSIFCHDNSKVSTFPDENTQVNPSPDAYCINIVNSLFSTEGHIFLVEQSLRGQFPSSSTKSRNTLTRGDKLMCSAKIDKLNFVGNI